MLNVDSGAVSWADCAVGRVSLGSFGGAMPPMTVEVTYPFFCSAGCPQADDLRQSPQRVSGAGRWAALTDPYW